MSRDSDIQKTFEIADDSLQGVLGYHFYILALQQSSNSKFREKYLPDNLEDSKQPVIPHTFSWVRYYRKEDLIDALKDPVFEFFQSRITLLAMVSVFEVALVNFIKNLNGKGHIQSLPARLSPKRRLQWAYESSIKCDIGDKDAIKRLSMTCSIIDNARRLRNLIVHNQGIFNEWYKDDAIECEELIIELHHLFKDYEKNPQLKIPITLNVKDIIRFSQAHIEVLHILHNYLQKEFFGFPHAYSYLTENKPIEWDKALWGEANVRFIRK